MFFFTFWEWEIANRIFLFAIDAIYIAPFGVYWINFFMFLVAAILNSSGTNAEVTEVWLTFVIYLVLAAINSCVQLMARQQLDSWYLHGGKITGEVITDDDVFDTLDDIRFHSL